MASRLGVSTAGDRGPGTRQSLTFRRHRDERAGQGSGHSVRRVLEIARSGERDSRMWTHAEQPVSTSVKSPLTDKVLPDQPTLQRSCPQVAVHH
jgi:hypothetical protein